MRTRAVAAALVVFGVGAPACRPSPPAQAGPASAAGEAQPPEPAVSGPCVPTGPELCFNGLDDNCNGLLDEGCGVRSGLVHFMAAWAEADVDVDLHVTDPGGEVAEVGHVSESGLTKQHDCPGKQNLCYGQNFENVYLEGESPPPGRYRVTVQLESLGGAQPPIAVRVGARIGGVSHNHLVRLMHEGDQHTLSFRLGEVSEVEDSGVRSTPRGTGTR